MWGKIKVHQKVLTYLHIYLLISIVCLVVWHVLRMEEWNGIRHQNAETPFIY